MSAARVAAGITFACMLALAPAWVFLTLLGGNGLNTRQGELLLGGVGACLLALLVAAPWLALRLTRALQPKLPDALAAIAGIGAALIAALPLLVLATGLLLAMLAQ